MDAGLKSEGVPNWITVLVEQVSIWADVSTNQHRFSGVEFRLGAREIGHAHAYGVVDIPFTVKIRDALIRSGIAERHHWLPNSGWITVHAEERGMENALKLLRLSYLRIQLKGQDPLKASQALLELATGEFAEAMTNVGVGPSSSLGANV